jgi:hypothetical protein
MMLVAEPSQNLFQKTVHARLPFTVIIGSIYEGAPSWSDAKSRAAALWHWRGKIIFEIGRHYQTKTERTTAEAFARSHRLSIANAFERRLCRKDVVEALGKLYQGQKNNEPVHDPGSNA